MTPFLDSVHGHSNGSPAGLACIRLLVCVTTAFVTMDPGAVAYTWHGQAACEAPNGNSFASSLFNVAFSSSIAFRLRACETSRAPNLAFHFQNVVEPFLCSRHTARSGTSHRSC